MLYSCQKRLCPLLFVLIFVMMMSHFSMWPSNWCNLLLFTKIWLKSEIVCHVFWPAGSQKLVEILFLVFSDIFSCFQMYPHKICNFGLRELEGLALIKDTCSTDLETGVLTSFWVPAAAKSSSKYTTIISLRMSDFYHT